MLAPLVCVCHFILVGSIRFRIFYVNKFIGYFEFNIFIKCKTRKHVSPTFFKFWSRRFKKVFFYYQLLLSQRVLRDKHIEWITKNFLFISGKFALLRRKLLYLEYLRDHAIGDKPCESILTIQCSILTIQCSILIIQCYVNTMFLSLYNIKGVSTINSEIVEQGITIRCQEFNLSHYFLGIGNNDWIFEVTSHLFTAACDALTWGVSASTSIRTSYTYASIQRTDSQPICYEVWNERVQC